MPRSGISPFVSMPVPLIPQDLSVEIPQGIFRRKIIGHQRFSFNLNTGAAAQALARLSSDATYPHYGLQSSNIF